VAGPAAPGGMNPVETATTALGHYDLRRRLARWCVRHPYPGRGQTPRIERRKTPPTA